jgi:hypothetical protein
VTPRITPMHAVAAGIPPIHSAFAAPRPVARLINLVDDSLSSVHRAQARSAGVSAQD